MGSPPAPQIANGWLSQFDDEIKDDATLYTRYMDDIVRDINKNQRQTTLKFTIERKADCSIPFLDMKIECSEKKLASKWYTKPTDTG